MKFLHANHLSKISSNGFEMFGFYGRLLEVYANDGNYIQYNFVDNVIIDSINGNKIDFAISSYKDNVIMLLSDSIGQPKTCNVNISTGKVDQLNLPSIFISQNTSHYIAVGNGSKYYFQNKSTNNIDSISIKSNQAGTFLLNDQGMTFFSDTCIYYYDFKKQTKQKVIDLKSYKPYKVDFMDFNSFYLVKVYDINRRERHLFFNSNHQLINSTDSYIGYIYPEKYRDGVLLLTSGLFQYFDLKTGVKNLKQTSASANNFVVLKDRYIIHKSTYELVIYDVDKDSIYKTGADTWLATTNFQYFDMGENIFLLNNLNSADGYKDVFDLDLNTFKIKESEYLVNSTSGFEKEAVIKRVGNDLFLLGKNIYLIKGNTTTLVNTHNTIQNINVAYYKIVDEKLYWIEKGSITFDMYKFENGRKQKYFSYPSIPTEAYPIPLFLRDYYPWGNSTILFSGGLDSRILLANNSTNKISDLNSNGSIEYGNKLILFQNSIYFMKSRKLYRIDENFSIIEIGAVKNFLSTFHIFKNQLYLADDTDFHLIKDDKAIPIIRNLSLARVSYNGDYMMISEARKNYVYDGQRVITYENDNNGYSFQNLYNDVFTTYRRIGVSDKYKLEFWNFKTNTQYVLPSAISDLRAIALFKYKNKSIFLARQHTDRESMYLYETDSLFSFFTLLKTISTSGRGFAPKFVSYKNEGLLYVGADVYFMDDNLNFIRLDMIGDEDANDVEIADGYFVIKGIDPVLGRQLYRFQIFSERVSTKDLPPLEPLNAYPNPTLGDIKISNNQGEVRLFNSNGVYISSGQDAFNLSNFSPGWYFLKDEKGKYSKILKL
jgi:hypothetical protein